MEQYVLFFVSTLVISIYGEFQAGTCPFDDQACEQAVAFAKTQSESCLKALLDPEASVPSVCIQDVLQLRRRFTVVFANDTDFENSCNPCGAGGTGGQQCNDGVPDLPESCPDLSGSEPIVDQDKFEISRFLPKFRWHQDANVPIAGRAGRIRECCITTKRTMPFLGSCGSNCFLVFCPFSGGYQWRDYVKCGVTQEDVNSGKFGSGVKAPSRIRCKKQCRMHFTRRSYLITNLPPIGWFGHCSYDWLPVWFQEISIPTHCTCPRI